MPLAARPPLCFITNDTSATMYGLLLSAACYWCAKLSALTRKTGQDWLIPRHSRTRSRWQKDPVDRSFPFPRQNFHRLSHARPVLAKIREPILSEFGSCSFPRGWKGAIELRRGETRVPRITGNKSFVTFIRASLYNASTTFPFFPIIKINLNRITKKTRRAKENTH